MLTKCLDREKLELIFRLAPKRICESLLQTFAFSLVSKLIVELCLCAVSQNLS